MVKPGLYLHDVCSSCFELDLSPYKHTTCESSCESRRKGNKIIGEILKFVVIMILAIQFEFSSQASLWSNTAPFTYISAPSFGKTRMPCNHFDVQYRLIWFSQQPASCLEHMSLEQYHWRLVSQRLYCLMK